MSTTKNFSRLNLFEFSMKQRMEMILIDRPMEFVFSVYENGTIFIVTDHRINRVRDFNREQVNLFVHVNEPDDQLRSMKIISTSRMPKIKLTHL